MRITVLGHCYAMPENRIKWKRFAEIFSDCDVTLLAPDRYERERYGDSDEHIVAGEGDKNYRFIALRQAGVLRGMYLESGRLLLKAPPDIFVVVENYDSWAAFQAFIWRELWAPRSVILGFSDQNIPIVRAKRHHIMRHSYMLRNIDAMYAYNEECVALLRGEGFDKPVLIQENTGVDERIWHPDKNAGLAERQRRGLDGFIIGYVGALVEEKGLLDLLAAVKYFRAKWRLLLAGGGLLRPRIESLAKELGIFDRIRFTGYVTRMETAALYRCMDALVLPSRTTAAWKEQFGVVLAEAMLSGVPVIGSSSGAIPEVIGDAGLVFQEGDVKALAVSLQRLHDSPSLKADMIRRGYQAALAKHSVTAMANQNHAFFRKLLNNNSNDRINK